MMKLEFHSYENNQFIKSKTKLQLLNILNYSSHLMFLTNICSNFVNIQSCTPLSFPYHTLNQLISKVYLPQICFILVGIYGTILELANKMKFRSLLSRFLPSHSKMWKYKELPKQQEHFYRHSFDIKSSKVFTYMVATTAVLFCFFGRQLLLVAKQTAI